MSDQFQTPAGDPAKDRERARRRWWVVFIPGPEWQPAADHIEASFTTRREAEDYVARRPSRPGSSSRRVVRENPRWSLA